MPANRLLEETPQLCTFRLAADERRAVGKDRRNGRRCLLLPHDFHEAPALGEAFQTEAAAVQELDICCRAEDAADGLGGKDLAAAGLGADAGGGIDGRAE